LLNLERRNDFILVVAWLVGSLTPAGPYPILTLSGEQGSGKSQTARLLRTLIDPSASPLRAEPKEVRDLIIAAHNSWIINIDNISYLCQWLSDALCRLSTGGGFSTRTPYSDADESIFDAKRPLILNGINEVAIRSDLLDRSIQINLPAITDDRRVTEKEMNAKFEAARPRVLGALLDFVVAALANREKVSLSVKPRMADFAEWISAAERSASRPNWWKPGDFMTAYLENRGEANQTALDAASNILTPLHTLLVLKNGKWSGTAGELLRLLVDSSPAQRDKGFPPNAQSLSRTLRRIAPNLRSIGIDVKLPTGKPRIIHIRKLGEGEADNEPVAKPLERSPKELEFDASEYF
jgi:putative DNA primase/helicase